MIVPNESLKDKIKETKAKLKRVYLSTQGAFQVAFSGGKDSTCVLQIFLEMLGELDAKQRRQSYVVATDTLVENPKIAEFLKSVIDSINKSKLCKKLKVKAMINQPEIQNRFFSLLIGKGYPSPTRTFRWCTDRLKIRPSEKASEKIVQKHGSSVIILGTRRAESSNRKKAMDARIYNELGLTLSPFAKEISLYSPIANWETSDVWAFLTTHNPPPWGKNHDELFALYTVASGNECEFIIDKSQSSCGNSRFGCFVCTLVNEDRSMQGFVSEDQSLKPLFEFRKYIKELRDDENMRAEFRRTGAYGAGPFISKARIMILDKLLEAEFLYKKSGGCELISDEELEYIQKTWSREFDTEKTAIKIAKKYERMLNMQDELKDDIKLESVEDAFNSLDEEDLEFCKKLDMQASDFKALMEDMITSEDHILGNFLDDKFSKGIDDDN